MTKKLIAVDLFCGAGGFSLAAALNDIQICMAVDKDKAACETYRKNLGAKWKIRPLIIERDVMDFPPEELLQKAKSKFDTIDILLGGPPCQGYSTHRLKDSGVKDSRNPLLIRYIEYVDALQPKVFLVENVPGLLQPKHGSYLKKLYQKAKQAGYDVMEPVTLNAKDYGVPQNRKRVFVLGVRRDINLAHISWPPTPTHFSPDSGKKPAWVNASVVFRGKMQSKDPNNIHMKHSPEMQKVFESTPRDGGSRHSSIRELECHKNHNGHRDVYGRIDPKKPGPTMTTACINPSKGRFLHPRKNHGITLRQAARFQSFPDDYIFSGGLISGGVQIGNAVPILLGKVILFEIKKALLSCET